jgi:serine/threonine protein kinase
LRELKHDNIVRYCDRILDRPNATIYIVMEYCEGGDLAQVIRKLKKTQQQASEDYIWKLLMNIVLALFHCHS